MSQQTIIYQAVNMLNGKRYIGLTEKGLRTRKMKHFGNAKRGQVGKFYTAIRKHGAGNFHFAELVSCKDYWRGLEVERLYISLLKPEYNMTAGGGGVKGLKFSDASKAKMSAAKKGKPGHPCPEWLKAHNADLRRAEKGKKRPTRCKRVYCVTDDLTFENGTKAALHYGVTRSAISDWCSGNTAPQGKNKGLVFRFYDEVVQ